MSVLSLEQIAREVAMDMQDGWHVNLGIGLPSMVASFVPADREVALHCENGMLGMGPPAVAGQEDPNLVDAGKRPVTLLPGGSFMNHADSFAIIRGGHLDACVMGAYEVAADGDLANWTLGTNVPAVGGAMDLAVGAKSIFIMTSHSSKDGAPKLVHRTALPLTARGVVSRTYTEFGIFVPTGEGFSAVALVGGIDVEEVRRRTGAELVADRGVRTLPTLDRARTAGRAQ